MSESEKKSLLSQSLKISSPLVPSSLLLMQHFFNDFTNISAGIASHASFTHLAIKMISGFFKLLPFVIPCCSYNRRFCFQQQQRKFYFHISEEECSCSMHIKALFPHIIAPQYNKGRHSYSLFDHRGLVHFIAAGLNNS